MLIRRLGEALAQTSRQVNMLERRLTPALRAAVTSIRCMLDEREERLRLKHLKSSRVTHGPFTDQAPTCGEKGEGCDDLRNR